VESQQQQKQQSSTHQSSTSTDRLPPLKSLDDEEEGEDTTVLGIAIKEAKIDPVRLIQFLTGKSTTTTTTSPTSNSNTNGSKTLRRRSSTERLNSHHHSSPHGSPKNRNKPLVQLPSSHCFGGTSGDRTKKSTTKTGATTTSSASASSPHDEAIEFELSISFNGRKYTAKRTMQCIVQLRDDLIREMNHRKQWLLMMQRKKAQQLSSSSSSSSLSPSTDNDGIGRDDVSYCMYNDVDDDVLVDIQIPEIPPLTILPGAHDHHHHHHHHHNRGQGLVGGVGFVGRGFTMLHALVTSYVPVMERWLKNVATIVPQDSECLMNFLWEPTSTNVEFGSILETNNNNNNSSSNNKLLRSSRTSMGSIKEIDSEDDS
jgi:hypothetical protein